MYSSSKVKQLFLKTMRRYSWYTSSECLKIKGLFIGLSPVNIQTVLRMRETALKQVENFNGVCKNLQFILHTSDTNKCQEPLYLMPPDSKVLARFSNCEIAPTISLQSAVCLPSVETNSCKNAKDIHWGGCPQSLWFDTSVYTTWNRCSSLCF